MDAIAIRNRRNIARIARLIGTVMYPFQDNFLVAFIFEIGFHDAVNGRAEPGLIIRTVWYT